MFSITAVKKSLFKMKNLVCLCHFQSFVNEIRIHPFNLYLTYQTLTWSFQALEAHNFFFLNRRS